MINAKHPDYPIWRGMRKRCYRKEAKDYRYYGGKGIRVCNRWRKFKNFIEDMGPRPSKKHSIDRIDPLKNYYKENCRWATRLEQTQNRIVNRLCKRGHKWSKKSTMWTYNGKRRSRRCRICYKDPLLHFRPIVWGKIIPKKGENKKSYKRGLG